MNCNSLLGVRGLEEEWMSVLFISSQKWCADSLVSMLSSLVLVCSWNCWAMLDWFAWNWAMLSWREEMIVACSCC